jgi:hypothetical protein
MSPHQLDRELRDALAELCGALHGWTSSAPSRRRPSPLREEEHRSLDRVRSSAQEARSNRSLPPELAEVLELLSELPDGDRLDSEGLLGTLGRTVSPAATFAASLEARDSLRDAASFGLLAEVLQRCAEGSTWAPELCVLAHRWRADPGQLSPELGPRPCLGPGGHVALATRSERCLGDTSFYVQLLDPPSGTLITELMDVPIEGVALSRDGLRIFAQRWHLYRERRCSVHATLSGQPLRGHPQPTGPEEVVMLADLFREQLGEEAPRTPLQIQLEDTPPRDQPAFLFGS